MKNKQLKFILLTSLAFATFANGHYVQGGGFINGLAHPVFGADHLLAMLAVGILSVQIGGAAIWKVPATFVIVMLYGGLWGMFFLPFFAVETGIGLSVLMLGGAIAFEKKMVIWVSMVFVGFFATFHGYAHGQEMPDIAHPILYALGFMITTVTLHITGVVIGEIGKHVKNGESFMRYVGAGIAGIGFSILFGL